MASAEALLSPGRNVLGSRSPSNPAWLTLLKAFDDYFAPFILARKIRVDQRFNQVNAKAGVNEKLLIGLLCSSWFVMTIETRGRTAMGQGALEMPTDTLRELEVPDIRELDDEAVKELGEATDSLLKGKRMTAPDLPSSPAQRALDSSLLRALDIDTDRLDELHTDTGRMRRVRKLLAQDRGAIQRERFETDLADVARDMAAQVAPLLKGRRFPEDFVPPDADTQQAQLGTAPITVEATGLMGQHHISVTNDESVVYEADLVDPIGEVFVRAVEMGRRDFEFPTDEVAADAALKVFDKLVAEIDKRLNELAAGVSTTAIGNLRELAEQELNLPVTALLEPVSTKYTQAF